MLKKQKRSFVYFARIHRLNEQIAIQISDESMQKMWPGHY